MSVRLSVILCLTCTLLSPVSGQGIFKIFSRAATPAKVSVPEETGLKSLAGYIFSDGKDTLGAFDSTRTDIAYRLKYTPRKKLVQIFTPYMVKDVCMPGDTLNPLFLKYVQSAAMYIDTVKKVLSDMYSASNTLKTSLPSLSGVADFAQCEYRVFPMYARTFNMVNYAHEDDQSFTKFYHLVTEEFRYVLFNKGKPVAYAIYIPKKPQFSGAAAIPTGDSILLTKFTYVRKMVAVSPYMSHPESFLPKNMGFGYINQGKFMLLQGQGGYLSMPLSKGKIQKIKVPESWEEKSPKVNIITALASAYNSIPQAPEPASLGPQ